MSQTQECATTGTAGSGDIQAIERLVRTYADICDENYDPERLGELFTEDAVWGASSESGTSDWGVYEGRQAIKEFFGGVSSQIAYAHHIVMSPEVDILEPGAAAKGRWNTIVLMRLLEDQYGDSSEAKVLSAVYTHRYRCEQGTWRIAHLHVHTRFDLRMRWVG